MSPESTTFQVERQRGEINLIKAETAKEFDLSVLDLNGKSKLPHISRARHVAMVLIRELTKGSHPDVAAAFNRKNHMSSIFAGNAHEKRVKDNVAFSIRVRDLRDRLTMTIELRRKKGPKCPTKK